MESLVKIPYKYTVGFLDCWHNFFEYQLMEMDKIVTKIYASINKHIPTY